MARRKAVNDDDATVENVVDIKAGSPGYDGDAIQEILEAIEQEEVDMDAIMSDARTACSPHRDNIKAQVNAAAELGVPKKVFATMRRKRKFALKYQTAESSLDENQLLEFRKLTDCLGDFATLPLGQAANDKNGAA